MIVTLEDGFLTVNRFWPAGCRLIPEGPSGFRLQAASRRIEFEVDAAGMATGLTYVLPDESHPYRKTG